MIDYRLDAPGWARRSSMPRSGRPLVVAAPLFLDVFDINPARRLYERLGFYAVRVSGRKIHMRRDSTRTR
jgi:hypothetical protein